MRILNLFLALFFLSSCSGNLHYTEKDFQDFIQEIQIEENLENKKISKSDENFFDKNKKSVWIEENFPINCDWLDLERVVDGDTIIVRNGRKRIRIRMIGIDTPESKKEGTAIQPHAIEASNALKKFLKSEKKVCLLEDQEGDKYDKYARRLSYVFTKDGKDLNGEMIKIGLARGYFYFPFERKSEFKRYENLAQKKKLGIWE